MINAGPNITTTARTGAVVVVSGQVTRTVMVTQPPLPRVSITWHPNGGTVNPLSSNIASRVAFNNFLSIPPTPTRTGYRFDGWFTQQTGGNPIPDIVPSSNAAYWARWSLPRSGSEIPYQPSLWANHMRWNNCYTYAINRRLGSAVPGEVPGEWSDKQYQRYFTTDGMSVSQALIAACTADAVALGGVFYRYTGGAIPTGHYIIALAIEGEGWIDTSQGRRVSEYHFYRPDAGANTWSHKRGNSDIITQRDASNNIITNPETANRNYPENNYRIFVGYFVVGGNYVGNSSTW